MHTASVFSRVIDNHAELYIVYFHTTHIHYVDKHFKDYTSRLAGARKSQLDVYKAIYISRKQSELCIQKEYVRKLYLFSGDVFTVYCFSVLLL